MYDARVYKVLYHILRLLKAYFSILSSPNVQEFDLGKNSPWGVAKKGCKMQLKRCFEVEPTFLLRYSVKGKVDIAF